MKETTFSAEGYHIQIIRLGASCAYCWLGSTSTPPTLSNLSLALSSKYDSLPSGSSLLSASGGMDPCLDIAKRLAKATGMQLFVSCGDLIDDRDLLVRAERKLRELLKGGDVAVVDQGIDRLEIEF
jgi:hypothetical protein